MVQVGEVDDVVNLEFEGGAGLYALDWKLEKHFVFGFELTAHVVIRYVDSLELRSKFLNTFHITGTKVWVEDNIFES